MAAPVLVTGASGFAGSHLLDLLTSEGATVVAWSRHGAPPHADGSVTWQTVDVGDAGQVDRAIAETRPAAIYHCAGDPQSNQTRERVGATFVVNVHGTIHVLQAVARHARGARVVVTGSALVYRASTEALDESSPLGPSSPYGVSKLAQEMVALRAAALDGLDVIVVRAFNHIGPRQAPAFVAASVARQLALMEAGAAEPVLKIGNLDAARDLTDVRDMVRGYRHLVERGTSGTVYNVCRGEARPIRALVAALVSRARVPVDIAVDPARLRASDVPVVLGSAARITRDTGWTPLIPPEQTLDDLLDYWRADVARTRSISQ